MPDVKSKGRQKAPQIRPPYRPKSRGRDTTLGRNCGKRYALGGNAERFIEQLVKAMLRSAVESVFLRVDQEHQAA